MIKALQNSNQEELITQLISKDKLVHSQAIEIENLKHQVKILQTTVFGKKSEKYIDVNAQQLVIDFGVKVDLDLPQDVELQQVSYHRKKLQKKRTDYSKIELPESLMRETTVIEPEGLTPDMVKIGEEITELLAIKPQMFYVKKIVRPKYANSNKQGILIADLPTRPLAGAKVDVSFLTTIILDKYLDHLPLYRQLKRYARLGVSLSDSTIGDWIAKALTLLEPLYQLFVNQIKKSNYIQTDESPIQVLDKATKGNTHRGYYWLYRDMENNMVLYFYDKTRGKSAALKILENYIGYLQTDGYIVYENLGNESIQHLCCMAHARRKFYESKDNNKAMAVWMLDKMQELYAIESFARQHNYTHEQRYTIRQEKAIPILTEIKQWLLDNIHLVTPQSAIGKAINYTLARIDKLTLYATNGILEIDNNLIENAVRPMAIGRKNYLFAGSHAAAQRAAMIYSFIESCKANNIDPHMWLNYTLSNIENTKISDLNSLLPNANFKYVV